MESDGAEASHQHPSTSMQDSSFNLPILPQELINEILFRLPVKSLLQFRSVSKSWLALISSPQFIKTHLSLSANNKDQTYHRLMMGFSKCGFSLKDCSFRSLFNNSVTEAYDSKYPMKLRKEAYSGVGSVNGLVCVVHGESDLFIWNPSIRKYKKLPDPIPEWRYDDHIYGFGYDQFHDDYKVVGFFQIYGSSPFVDVKVYSLKSDSWREIHYCMDGEIFDDSGTFVNGKLHWTASIGPDDKWSKIICIDLTDEYWGNVEDPFNGKGDSLGVLGNDLAMFDHHIATGVDLWVMKEYGIKESWTKMFTIKYPVDDVPKLLLFPSLFLSSSGEILVGSYSTFMIFNAKGEPFRYVEVINSDHHWPKGIIYIESLVSPLSMEQTKDATKRKSKQRLKKLGQSSNKKFE